MGETALPDGYVRVPVITTYLEMRRPVAPAGPPVTPEGFAVDRWERPPLDGYREMFRAVGGPWGWTGRLLLRDDELADVTGDGRVEIWRLTQAGGLAGFIELDCRTAGEVEIAYFGLRPEFIGRGLGGFMLRWAVSHVWSMPGVERFWLHTCDYDHPGALRAYERAGFRVYDRRTGLEAYPAEHVARVQAERPGG